MVVGGRLTDWGCGTGDFTREFNRRSFVTTGFDVLEHTGGKTFQADFEKPIDHFKAPPDHAHMAFCRNVLEHLRDPSHLLKAMHANLVDGGVAVICVPDWRTYREIFYADYTHVRPYDRVSLPDLLKVSGFAIDEVHELVQHPPCWNHTGLTLAASLARTFVPLRWAQAISEWTGSEFWRWACLRTLVVICHKA
jgi:trans-aconitate methyltransferase